jgi:hypothetical protein
MPPKSKQPGGTGLLNFFSPAKEASFVTKEASFVTKEDPRLKKKKQGGEP